ncbi:MAG: Xaa-Pro peptidase family protein [Desulfobacterales bacterium]|jgi:Xaa-Pro aminopeptidase
MPALNLDFSKDEYLDRQKKVRVAMEKEGIELLMVHQPVNINYLTGSRAKGWQTYQVLFFPLNEGPLTFLTRLPEIPEVRNMSLIEDIRPYGGREPENPIDFVGAIVREKGYLNLRIGMEAPQYYLTPDEYKQLNAILGDAKVCEPNTLIQDIKLIRSPAELAFIKKAVAMTDPGMNAAIEAMRRGSTEYEVSAAIHHCIISMGSDPPASPLNICMGDRSHYSHWQPDDKMLKKGDFGHIQFGPSYKRYSATIGRQICLGKPTARQKEIYQIARDATEAVMSRMREGVPGAEMHKVARDVISKAGMDHGRIHSTGYAMGMAFPPSFVDAGVLDGDSKYILAAGMVVAVEPPVFSWDECTGARLIQNVLITKTGIEQLPKTTLDLIEIQ